MGKYGRSVICRPNPAHGGVVLMIGTGQGAAEIGIYDVTGMRVRSFGLCRGDVQWNRCDDNGKRLPAGCYFVKVESAVDRQDLKIVLLD